MTKTITIETERGDFRARTLPSDDGWQYAAGRAVRRAYGRSACAYRWNHEGWRENAQGETVAVYYRASIVGPDRGYGQPILGEARVTLRTGREG